MVCPGRGPSRGRERPCEVQAANGGGGIDQVLHTSGLWPLGTRPPLQDSEGIPGGKKDSDRKGKCFVAETSACSPRGHTGDLSIRHRWRVTGHPPTPPLHIPPLQAPTPSHLPMEYPLPPTLTQPPTRFFLTSCSSSQLPANL